MSKRRRCVKDADNIVSASGESGSQTEINGSPAFLLTQTGVNFTVPFTTTSTVTNTGAVTNTGSVTNTSTVTTSGNQTNTGTVTVSGADNSNKFRVIGNDAGDVFEVSTTVNSRGVLINGAGLGVASNRPLDVRHVEAATLLGNTWIACGNSGVSPGTRFQLIDADGVTNVGVRYNVTGITSTWYNNFSISGNVIYGFNSAELRVGRTGANIDFEVINTAGTSVFLVDTSVPQILCPPGSLSNPGISFVGDNNTGWYNPTDNQVALGLGTTLAALFTTAQISFNVATVAQSSSTPFYRFISTNAASSTSVAGVQIETQPARAGGITYSVTGESTRGFYAGTRYNGGSPIDRFTFQGSLTAFANPGSSTNGLDIMSIKYNAQPQVLVASGVVGNPGLSWLSDITTGMYLISAGNIGVSISGVNKMAISTSEVNVTGGAQLRVSGATTAQIALDANSTSPAAQSRLQNFGGNLYWGLDKLNANVIATGGTTTLTVQDVYRVNSTPATVTLPAASSCPGRVVTIVNIGANTTTITRAGSDTIDDGSTTSIQIVADREHVSLRSDGTSLWMAV